ncbi:MAG: hypothetical protein IPK93_03240 [Solirubrobacterales bacterium]|nr:hypothetical protein [Solirubrobacterales bacterium]
MKELRIDRERAIKASAVAGLVVLGLSILPGLLKTPEAPELPPDVGFTAAETNAGAPLPDPGQAARPSSGKKEPGRNDGQGKGKSDDRNVRRKDRLHAGRKHPRKPKNPDKSGQTRGAAPTPAGSTPAGSLPASPAPASPAPAPVPSRSAPAPPRAPAAPAPAAPRPPPGDGSQEFAPR